MFLRFKGGKGVATGVGSYLPVVPLAVVCALVIWAAIFWRVRIVSLASIVATALVPFWVYFWYWIFGTPAHPGATAASVGIGCLLIIAKHRENLGRLLAGTELRFERSKRTGGTDPAGADLRAREAGGQ